MRRLVVLEAHGTQDFVDALRRAWDDGDAVLPLDPRLPGPAREQVLRAARPDEPVEAGDALVMATSGTSGVPKAVVLSHRAVAASSRATSERLAVDPDHDQWLACLPLAHVGGLSVVTRALHTGTPLSLLEHPDPDAIERMAKESDRTLVSLVPALLGRIDAAWFRTILLGGSTTPSELPANAVTTYGMTETGSGVVYDGVPLAEVEVRVVDGEIHLRGPMLLRAYRDGTDPKDDDGWFATGDVGDWDSSTSRLQVAGRLGELIISGGENVWPAPVERTLGQHPGVQDVLVFGRDDPEWGQRVVARIVPTDPADPPTLQALRDHVKQTLPVWAAPRELELVSILLRTASGKLVRG